MSAPAIPAGMKAWHGGSARAPADWDGGPVLFRSGVLFGAPPGTVWKLGWGHCYGSGDVVAYSARDDLPQPSAWATALACTADQNTFPKDSYGLALWLDKACGRAIPAGESLRPTIQRAILQAIEGTDTVSGAADTIIAALPTLLTELEGALKPFAIAAATLDLDDRDCEPFMGPAITCGHLRRALAAYRRFAS